MLKTKNEITFNRRLGPLVIPAGSPVELNKDYKKGNLYFIDPKMFEPNSMLRHDAFYYGFLVEEENVEGIEPKRAMFNLSAQFHAEFEAGKSNLGSLAPDEIIELYINGYFLCGVALRTVSEEARRELFEQ